MYSRLIDALTDFLNPHFISTHSTDIFEETMLKAAGVESQPKKCQFGPADDEHVYFRIKGISEEEAAIFLAFLKTKCEDDSASHNYLPELEAVAQDYRDTHYFKLDQAKVNAKLVDLFKVKFDKISLEKIAQYKKQSENDYRVQDYKNDLQRGRYHRLVGGLKQFLNPELISIHECDIFEETLLKLAGVAAQPTKCRFSMLDHEKMYLRIQGINADDAETLLGFFKEKCDDAATSKFIPAVSENQPAIEDGMNESHHFEIHVEKVIEKLVPLFKAEYPNLSQEKLDAYRKLSEKSHEIRQEVYYKTSENWAKLVDGVESFANTHLISCYPTDIFEETLLKLAGVQTQPQKSQFAPIPEKGKMYVRVKGINEADVETFLKFFRETCGDASATHRFVKDPSGDISDELVDAHSFEVNLEMVLNKLLPQFKDEINRVAANSPEKLEGYRKLSENHANVKKVKLSNLLSDILTLTASLKQANVSEFTKGQLDILFTLMDPALAQYAEHKDHKDCDAALDSTEKLAKAGVLFNSAYEKNDNLKNNETATKLNDSLKALSNGQTAPRQSDPMQALLSQLGLFGGRPAAYQLSDNNDTLEVMPTLLSPM